MFKSDGTLKSFTVAYSQVEPKKYVQDLIEADKARVTFYNTFEAFDKKFVFYNKLNRNKKLRPSPQVEKLFESNGLIYVCGDGAGMGKGVQTVLSNILTSEKYFSLLKEKRIREDLWR